MERKTDLENSWFTDKLRNLRKQLRGLNRRYLANKQCPDSKSRYYSKLAEYRQQLMHAKEKAFKSLLSVSRSPMRLYSILAKGRPPSITTEPEDPNLMNLLEAKLLPNGPGTHTPVTVMPSPTHPISRSELDEAIGNLGQKTRKARGFDDITPLALHVEFQIKSFRQMIENILQACMRLNYFPAALKEGKTIFIRKTNESTAGTVHVTFPYHACFLVD